MELRLCIRDDAGHAYLEHHGVKGQKHGERRYQNEDGSLTKEGYEHYAEMYGWGEGSDKDRSKYEKEYARQEKKLEKLDRNANIGQQKKEAQKRDLLVKKSLENTVSRTASAALITAIAGGDFVKALVSPLTFGGMAAYHKVMAETARRRMTDVGHAKAVEKYNQQYEKMVEQFKDTPFQDVLAKQHQRKIA